MKKWSTLIACILISAGIWLIHNLSGTHTDVVTVSVIAESSIEGRAVRSEDVVTISARCHASGFRLLYLGSRKDAFVVRIDPCDLQFKEGEYYTISSNLLSRYVPAIFGQNVTVEAFLFDNLQFRFTSEDNRKVPVQAVCNLEFASEYMQVSDIRLTPDSVLVYGPENLLRTLESVQTRPIEKYDVKSNLRGEVALVEPAGLRVSPDMVGWSLEVSRYVEVETVLPVEVRGAPEGSELILNPSTVVAGMRCNFPLMGDPGGNIVLYIDYSDYSSSINGCCVVRHDELPAGVISLRIDPAVVDCEEPEEGLR